MSDAAPQSAAPTGESYGDVPDSGRFNSYGGDNDWGDSPLDAPAPADSDDLPPISTDPGIGDEADPAPAPDDVPNDPPAGEDGDGDDGDGDGDGDDESDGDADGSGDDDGEDDPKPKQKVSGMVPRSRINKIAKVRDDYKARLEAAEARLREYESGAAPADGGDGDGDGDSGADSLGQIDSQLDMADFSKMADLMVDGKNEEASALFSKMMAQHGHAVAKAAVEAARKSARDDARAEVQRDRTQTALQATASELAQSYPELDASSEHADRELIGEVVSLRDYYASTKGMDMVSALRKAVKTVAAENELVDQKAATSGKSTKTTKGAPGAQPKVSDKKLEAAARERGPLGGDGNAKSEQVLDITKLTDDQWANLSLDQKKKARGDYL